MLLRSIAIGVALAGATATMAFAQAQTTSPALTASSGGKGDSATAVKSEQDPTLGSDTVKPKTPMAARPHARHHMKKAPPMAMSNSAG